MKPQRVTCNAARLILIGKTIAFLIILFCLMCSKLQAQRGNDWRTNADLIVEQADSLSLRSQETFYLNRIIRVDKGFKNDKTIKETWYYTLKDNKVVIFQVRYLIDSTEYTESYYVNKGRLVCMEHYASAFFSKSDEVKWGQVLFYDNNNLKLFVSVGHEKPAYTYGKVGPDALNTFLQRYEVLVQNLR